MTIIGYTTGTYDMFHSGHVKILESMKKLCDVIIVGVTTDELCSQQKNKTPVINLQNRMTVLKSCRHVDIVVPHHGETKLDAWNKYKFDILFIGSDYIGKEEYTLFEKQKPNINVIYLPYSPEISSTQIRNVVCSSV
jgi:glycerol-3-phosphate cytidylyltransferase